MSFSRFRVTIPKGTIASFANIEDADAFALAKSHSSYVAISEKSHGSRMRPILAYFRGERQDLGSIPESDVV